jgi:malonate-semialdehyde dehydrogenase (acetylating)/methylmalonate-semialdehyde dehydrogenase
MRNIQDRTIQAIAEARMTGVNVPVPVPVAFCSSGGWKDSLPGDAHVHGSEGVRFRARGKAITSRWPDAGYPQQHREHMHFPTAT